MPLSGLRCVCSAPPLDLVHIVRRRLAHPGTVLGGFRTIIDGSDGRPMRFMTWHHLVKVRHSLRAGGITGVQARFPHPLRLRLS